MPVTRLMLKISGKRWGNQFLRAPRNHAAPVGPRGQAVERVAQANGLSREKLKEARLSE